MMTTTSPETLLLYQAAAAEIGIVVDLCGEPFSKAVQRFYSARRKTGPDPQLAQLQFRHSPDGNLWIVKGGPSAQDPDS
jgi:hypothetical protein